MVKDIPAQLARFSGLNTETSYGLFPSKQLTVFARFLPCCTALVRERGRGRSSECFLRAGRSAGRHTILTCRTVPPPFPPCYLLRLAGEFQRTLGCGVPRSSLVERQMQPQTNKESGKSSPSFQPLIECLNFGPAFLFFYLFIYFLF